MSLVYHCDRRGLNTARVWNLWVDGPHSIPTSNRPPDPLDDYAASSGQHLCKDCHEALETFPVKPLQDRALRKLEETP